MNTQFTYYAFISYKREDERWARWLQKKLESYGFPVGLRKENPALPAKIRPVFRDQSELSGGNLNEEIAKSLDGSKFLIVICSPRAAKSPWVSKEIQYFIDHGRENRIIPFIIGGTPNSADPADECFPESLRQLSGERELLGININEMGRDAAAIKVIARMFSLRFDNLWQRHERTKRRRRWTTLAIVLLFAFVSFAVGVIMTYQNSQIKAERDRAEKQTDIANKERNRANAERDKVLTANRLLAQAKDSIQLQSNMLVNANHDLKESNRHLAEERDNVRKANIDIQKEQIRLNAEKAEKMYSDGQILPALRLITQWLPSSEHPNIPEVPEAVSVLDKIMAHLEEVIYNGMAEYREVDFLPGEEGMLSNDGRWYAFADQGLFYLYDCHNQEIFNLQGEGFTDDYKFYFTNDNKTLIGKGIYGCNAWDIASKTICHNEQVDSLNIMMDIGQLDFDEYYGYNFKDISFLPKYEATGQTWENYYIISWETGDSVIFPDAIKKSEDNNSYTISSYFFLSPKEDYSQRKI